MSIINTRNAAVFQRIVRLFGCVSLILSTASCNSPSHHQQTSESEVNPITHVARFIATPFRATVEKDLRSLIHQASQEPDCDSSSGREQLISQLISPTSVNVLQQENDAYWDQALPVEAAKKEEVLDSVEQNLALHMHNIKQSITATGLKIGDNNTQVALRSVPSMPHLPAAGRGVLMASPHALPVPVLKHPAHYASTTFPVPVLKGATRLPVPLYKMARNDAAKGGPFVPLRKEDFSERYRDLSRTLKQLVALENLYTALPIGNPMPGGAMTSGFGIRRDPFNHRPARHTGIDFSSHGTPAVYSTGAGKVIFAGRRSDYGNMVVVDHGHGLTSRYAHLSQLAVRDGQAVTDRTLVGYQGHTGRATGSHLHYEVRMNGRAVNPASFVAATPPVCRYNVASHGKSAGNQI